MNLQAKAPKYSFIKEPDRLNELILNWKTRGITSVAMDFEGESNLHCYGEHLCIVQIFDGEEYHIIDALVLKKSEDGLNALRNLFEGDVEKIMFACQSDSSLVRKTLGMQMENVFDVRVIAMALGFMGNLTALISRNLGLETEDPAMKKKYQTANWMRRPIPNEQIIYALGDVEYLFQLKESLLAEMAAKLPKGQQKQVLYNMRKCAEQKNPERPGWEKICNFKLLSEKEKVFIKHFFIARDNLAREADVPASRILEKQLIVAMAKSGTWEGSLKVDKMQYKSFFEHARLDALKELGK